MPFKNLGPLDALNPSYHQNGNISIILDVSETLKKIGQGPGLVRAALVLDHAILVSVELVHVRHGLVHRRPCLPSKDNDAPINL